jgi:gas vesicle structural protein
MQTMTRGARSSSLADVLEIVLDKGIVIDAFVRVSLVGIELLTIEARVVIASVDTYIKYAEAMRRLDMVPHSNSVGLPALVRQVTREVPGVVRTVTQEVPAVIGATEQVVSGAVPGVVTEVVTGVPGGIPRTVRTVTEEAVATPAPAVAPVVIPTAPPAAIPTDLIIPAGGTTSVENPTGKNPRT